MNSRSVPANVTPPRLFPANKAATLRDEGNSETSNPEKIITKVDINWGRASATQIKRVLVDAEGDTQSRIQHVDDVVSQRDACKAFEKAPRIPTPGTSSVSMFNERLRTDLLFLDEIITLQIMHVFSKYPILARARSEHPQEVWDAFSSSRVGVFGAQKSLHLDEGGEWENDLWGDLCVGGRIKLVFQGVGAHP